MNATKQPPVYQLKVTLTGTKPPIWRRFLVPANILLSQLHSVLQIVMGWEDCHLHQFDCKQTLYGIPDEESHGLFDMNVRNEKEYRLSELLQKEKESLVYDYDFGDGWSHKVVLEKLLSPDKSLKRPLCLKGKGACPPEDCGGIWGYQDLLEILSDPSHPESEEMLEWIGRDFDPAVFNPDAVNAMLTVEAG